MRSLVALWGRAFSGLRFRLLVLVVLACAPLVVLMLHTAGEDRRRAIAGWRQRSQRLVDTARREEQELVDGTRQLLLAISESSSVRSLNARNSARWLKDLLGSYPRYANLGVLTTNGSVLASAVPVEAAGEAQTVQLVRRVLQRQGFAVDKFPATHTVRPMLRFGYPVANYSGERLAVVFADLDLNWFQSMGSELPRLLLRGATWTELDQKGVILARLPKPEGWLGRRLPEKALLPALWDTPQGVLEATNSKGVPHFYAFSSMLSPLAGHEVVTLLGVPRHILFAEADRMLARNLSWLGIAAGLALVVGWTASQLLILRPVRALVASAARLAGGDLSVRTGLPHGPGEVGQLTRAFDQMAQALDVREQDRQRTRQKLQMLSHRLVEVQESERRHIARELHDEIGQSLTAAEMNLQAALSAKEADALERRLQESIQAVERVLEQVHDLSLNLRPLMLDDLGLEPALRSYTHRQAALIGATAQFRAEPLMGRLDPLIETECFRVAQEALTNVVRHANAKAVSVELSPYDSHLHLRIRDDGVGFDVRAQRREAVHGASLGLLSMEERAALAGGGLELKSVPGGGTEIHAWFPLRLRRLPGISADFNE